MKTRTKIKAGQTPPMVIGNHNGVLVRASGVKTKMRVRV